jgi:hypothetical protein
LEKVSPPGTGFSSNSLVGLKIVFFCGLGLVLGGGIFMASRMSHALQFSNVTSEATVRTTAGDWQVERPSEVGPGLPVYPDALLVLPGHGSAPAAPKNNRAEVHSSVYYSADPNDLVDNWYVEHLGSEFTHNTTTDEGGIAGILSDASVSNSHSIFVGQRGDQVRIVAIASDSTGTRITLVRSTKHTTP